MATHAGNSVSMASVQKHRGLNPAFDAAVKAAIISRDEVTFGVARDTLNAARTSVAEGLITDALHAPHARDRIQGARAILEGTGVLRRDPEVVVATPARELLAELRAWNVERRALGPVVEGEVQEARDEERACVESTDSAVEHPSDTPTE